MLKSYATTRQQRQLLTSSLLIDGCSITPVKFSRNIGVHIVFDLSLRTHVQRMVSRCFASLRERRQIRRSVPSTTFRMLVVTLVHSRLDCEDGLLVNLPAYLMRQLQSALKCGGTDDLPSEDLP